MLPYAAQHVQFFARLAVMPQRVCFVALNVELDGHGLSSAFTSNNLREKRPHQQAVRKSTAVVIPLVVNFNYYMASFVGGQDKSNPAL